MTMHLVRGMTTINTKKRKSKGITQKDRQAQADHDKWLRKMGVHPDQLKAKGKTKPINKIPDYRSDRQSLPTSDKIDGHCPQKQSQEYTGERKLLGVAVMHKSNLVPIFADNKEEAKEIARMRRN